jgi:GT2 family glycosyltransferase
VTGSNVSHGVQVSYVVLTCNSVRYVEACIRSLVRARTRKPSEPPDEVWVVDNGSTDGTRERLLHLAQDAPELRVIPLEKNCGTTVSRNLALKQTTGRYVAVVDSDVEVPAGAVDTLLTHLAGDSTCGIIVPRLEYPDRRRQLSADRFPTLQHKFRRYGWLKQMERKLADPLYPTPYPVDYAISAFWLMRRELLSSVGLLDERIFYAPEDVDYCIRVWKAGFQILYDPAVCVIHDAREISRGIVPTRATFSHAAGLAYLFWKHRYMLRCDGLYREIGHAVARRQRESEALTC